MTPTARVFDRLAPLLPNCTVVDWIPPRAEDSVASYAQRLVAEVALGDCFLGGVSFGGIVALEVARLIHPKTCFLISSVRSPKHLPPWFRLPACLADTRVLAAAGHFAASVPKRVRSGATVRMAKLAGDDGAWYRWAASAVLRWTPGHEPPPRVCHIHGAADRTFPIRYTSPDIVIPGGGHVLPATHPGDVAEAMLTEMLSAT